jgi:hypothetical protein
MSLKPGIPAFDYEEFSSLTTADLVAYMEPIVTDPLATVPSKVLEQMAAEMEGYDEYHLVYAIELGMERMPEVFAPRVALLLSHQCQSVRLAAHRNLARLPSSLISDHLIAVCDQAVEAGKASAGVRDIVGLLQRKQSTGT